MLREVEGRLRTGTMPGRLWIRNGRAVGLVLWEPPDALGITVRFCLLLPEDGSSPPYDELFRALAGVAGPIAFIGPVPDLSGQDGIGVMASVGFAPFHRSEMHFPPAARPPSGDAPPGISVRPMAASDLAAVVRIHASAYAAHFDRYLFFEDSDPERDAEKAVGSLIRGHWGEFLPSVSRVAEAGDAQVGATVVVRSEGRALIADVAVDPAFQGQGIGRVLLTSTLEALRARRESVIALAVTEENRRATRLYERLGFVRARGPERRWYNPRVIPVAPGPG